MPGGAPIDVSFETGEQEIAYPFQGEDPCLVEHRFGLERHRILEVCHMAMLFMSVTKRGRGFQRACLLTSIRVIRHVCDFDISQVLSIRRTFVKECATSKVK